VREARPVSWTGTTRTQRLVLAALLALTVGTSPLEGYLLAVNPYATKLAPSLLVAAWAAVRLTHRVLPRMTPAGWLALALLAVVCCSSAVNTDNPYLLGYVIRWVPFLVLVVVISDLVRTDVSPAVVVDALALGAVVAAAGALYSFVVLNDSRATGPLTDPNDLAYVLVTALPLVVLGRRSSAPRWEVGLRFAGVALLLAGMAMTVSRGGAVALLALLVWAAAQHLISLRMAVVMLLLGVLAGGLTYTFAGAHVRAALAQKTYVAGLNIQTRELRWEAAARELTSAPLLGVGPGGVRQNYVAYAHNAELDAPDPVTHNMYLEVGAELGVVGLCLFLGTVAAGIVAGARAPAGWQRLGLALQGSLVAALTASTFLSEEYYMALWAPIAVSAGLALREPVGRTPPADRPVAGPGPPVSAVRPRWSTS
jgi:O-antigen ligase